MDLQVRSFRSESAGHCRVMIARGVLDIRGIKTLFHEIASPQSSLRCKVLVDLIDAILRLDTAEIDAFFHLLQGGPWSDGNAVAFIVPAQFGELPRLMQLRYHLVQRGLRVAIFSDTKVAIDWLALEN